MTGNLGADLDELFPQRRQRPMLNISGQRQPPQEVRQVVGQRKQLQPRLVVFERAAGELRPLHGVLALLDPLFRRAAGSVPHVVES